MTSDTKAEAPNAKEQEGRSAFASGLGLDANPYSFLDGRWDWSTGWFNARAEALQEWTNRK